MFRNILPVLVAVVVTLILTSVFQPLRYLPSIAQTNVGCETFLETSRMLCGRFLDYWRKYGGLQQFGYPISNQFTEISDLNGNKYTVQYFERAVFELHPENRSPYDILLSQLGTLKFNSKYPSGEPGAPYVENLPVYPGAQDVRVVRSDGADKNVTTFTSKDKLEAILAFYKDVMARTGWVLEEQGYTNALAFVYPRKPNEPAYAVYLVVESASERQTKVTLRLQITYPR